MPLNKTQTQSPFQEMNFLKIVELEFRDSLS